MQAAFAEANCRDVRPEQAIMPVNGIVLGKRTIWIRQEEIVSRCLSRSEDRTIHVKYNALGARLKNEERSLGIGVVLGQQCDYRVVAWCRKHASRQANPVQLALQSIHQPLTLLLLSDS